MSNLTLCGLAWCDAEAACYLPNLLLLLCIIIALCKLDGCTKEVFVDQDKTHEFCCRSHAYAYMENKAKEGERSLMIMTRMQ